MLYSLLGLGLGLALVGSVAAAPHRAFSGTPDYENVASKELIEAMIEAHGGLEPWEDVETLRFSFFTKVINPQNPPPPFYSHETTNLDTGASYIEWPLLDAKTVWNGETVWQENFIPVLPAGFFAHLSTSFMTMPWLTQHDDFNISAPYRSTLLDGALEYDVVRVTADRQSPIIPGEYFELFIDPETRLLKAIGFNITHPGMTRIAGQSIGPNYHVFQEYTRAGDLLIPTYYDTEGSVAANGLVTRAIHSAFNLQINVPLTEDMLAVPDGASIDQESVDWWSAGG